MSEETHDKRLFWGCFIALIATAFGFVIRTMLMNEWGVEFGLSETQKGELLGVGLWPFAISIVLFSLIIDKIGYGRAMVFAFICHTSSTVLIIFANGYWMLWGATFIMALGAGTVEAVINPVVATMFRNDKTKWLNILHAGWPGGMLIGGILAVIVGKIGNVPWQFQIGLVLVPTIIYGIMLFGRKFPIHERVEAGVSYIDMLKEVGFVGAFIIVALMSKELARVAEEFGFLFGPEWSETSKWTAVLGFTLVVAGGFGAFVKSVGRPLFVFLLLIMIPLATTELGTDSWITPLMEASMNAMSLPPVSVLLYTSFIMMVLRFSAGPIVEKLSPIGLLMGSAAIAAIGLYWLSLSAGFSILLAATFYAFGKTFFWPTMLGMVAERFPKGGALTMNTIAAVGMMSVGTVGAVFLGFTQDNNIDKQLMAYDAENKTSIHSTYVTDEKESIFGKYKGVDHESLKEAPEETQAIVAEYSENAKRGVLATAATFPVFMFVCFAILFIYFKSQGGYKVVHIHD